MNLNLFVSTFVCIFKCKYWEVTQLDSLLTYCDLRVSVEEAVWRKIAAILK